MYQAGITAPVLGRRVGEHDLGRLALVLEAAQQRAGVAGDRVGLLCVGKGEQLGDNEADILGRLPEAQVELTAHAAGHMGDDTVQRHASLFVGVDAGVDVLAQEPSALGPAVGVCALQRAGSGSGVAAVAVLEKGRGVSHGGKSQADDGAAPGRVHKLVDAARLETGGQVDVVGVGLGVVHLVLHPHEGELVAADGRLRAVGVIAHGERRCRVVDMGWRVGQVRPVRQQKKLGGLVGLELAKHAAHQRLAVFVQRLRRVQADEARVGGNVRLPPAEEHGVALSHQVAVARVTGRVGIEVSRRAVEVRNRLAASVHDVVQQRAVAAFGVHGL